VVKAMQAQGLEWSEGYRGLDRLAMVVILQGQMAQAFGDAPPGECSVATHCHGPVQPQRIVSRAVVWRGVPLASVVSAGVCGLGLRSRPAI
jgi:hypothetical protein